MFSRTKGSTVFCRLELHVLGEIWLNAGLNLAIFLGTRGPGV